MTTAFYTIAERAIISGEPKRNIDFNGFMNSFKKFHPDIPMLFFDEKHMAKLGVNFYNAKAAFGAMLINEGYDLVVNTDCDIYYMDRCEEILSADYDIAAPLNDNITGNVVGIKVCSGLRGESKPVDLVSCKDYLQGGLIASPSKQFWAHYDYASRKHYDKFVCLENDILNIVATTYPYKVKELDNAAAKCWYGCSIIGKEKACYIENGKIMCEGKPVKAYHFAHGGAKKKYSELFSPEVSEFIRTNIIH